MGCDVHMYPEYRSPGGHWVGFGKNFGARDYALFGYLAEVRGEGPAVVPPRGLPSNMAWEAASGYWYWVTDEPTDAEGQCTRASAESWVKSGISEWRDSEQRSVSDPGAHTPSYLSLSELHEVFKLRAKNHPWPVDVEYVALLAALDSLADNGKEVRVVFWFDN